MTISSALVVVLFLISCVFMFELLLGKRRWESATYYSFFIGMTVLAFTARYYGRRNDLADGLVFILAFLVARAFCTVLVRVFSATRDERRWSSFIKESASVVAAVTMCVLVASS